MAIVLGSENAETLTGSKDNDVITALGGDDTIIGSYGKDDIDGGNGSDTVDYSSFANRIAVTLMTSKEALVSFDGLDRDTLLNVENIIGGAGDDRFGGDSADNSFSGNDGNDTFYGSNGKDHYDGGNGRDTIDYSSFDSKIAVTLTGDKEAPVRFDGVGRDVLVNVENIIGGNGNDRFFGDSADNSFWGNGGNDTFVGSLGKDYYNGGSGSDTVDYSNFEASIAISLNRNLPVPASFDGVDRDLLLNIENVRGGSGDDYLAGDSRDNTFRGNGGDDYFVGSKGADTYYGDSGYDMVDYGSIRGALVIKPTGGAFTFASVNGGAHDRLSSIENIRGGVFGDRIVGNGANNNFLGNDGNDWLSGGAGGDRLVGGRGNDRLTGGADSDVFVFRSGDGVDVVTDFDASGSDHDVLDLRGVGSIDNFKDLMSMHVSQRGDSLLIYGEPGDAIELKHVDIDDLEKSDFLF